MGPLQEDERLPRPLPGAQHGRNAPPTLEEALREGGVYYRIEGETKQEVLRSIVGCLRLPDGVDRDYLLKVLLAREDLASTAIGEGLAIPHVRSPIVLHLVKPMVALCIPERPVDFGALDGQPVHALFTLICPTVRTHLRLLSRLTFALRDAGFAGAVRRGALRDEIFAEAKRIEGAMPAQGTA